MTSTLCALIHDIGDVLTPHNHPDLAAAVLKPFVSEENHWMVAHHDVSGYTLASSWGNRNARDAFET